MDKLQDLSQSELQELLDNPERVDSMALESDEIQNIQLEREMALASNRSLAEQNLDMKPRLESQKEVLVERYSQLQSVRENYLKHCSLRDGMAGQVSPEALLSRLQTEGGKTEAESEGAAPASRTPLTLLPPQTLLLWLQALVRPTPHHNSHPTQDQAHLSPLRGATPVPSLLLGPWLRPCALTPASPLSLPLSHTLPLANTPPSTPRVAPWPTRLLTTTAATVTQLGQPTPAHSLRLGGLDQDMECHSPTPENPTAYSPSHPPQEEDRGNKRFLALLLFALSLNISFLSPTPHPQTLTHPY
ncbi:unnamed protein product [Tetraodon nigroviridis]|uniref:(spotted green pufferfish) hypothetical protein n=1 Tax=Tetraodon nigroviridis TaxID=99883 RepID=Q4RKB6_TETNG|nr:unnamed protein product [Tetraodon nigroviridis]